MRGLILAILLLGIATIVRAEGEPLNAGFETGELEPWTLVGEGRIAGQDTFAPPIEPPEGNYFAHITTNSKEFSGPDDPNWLSHDVDGDLLPEGEASWISVALSIRAPSIVSFKMNILAEDFFEDVVGVSTGPPDEGPYPLLFAITDHESPYAGAATRLTVDDFTLQNVDTGATGYSGQTGFHTYAFPLQAGQHIVTFFVADTLTDGVATGIFLDDLRITSLLEVGIDVKPASLRNRIRSRNRRPVPVAILSGEGFHVNELILDSIRFGPADITPQASRPARLRDVNRDGLSDLVVWFRPSLTGILAGDTEACLHAETVDGAFVEGCDSIRTAPSLRPTDE